MDWKTDSTDNETEMEPYSTFQSNKSGRWMDRMELPIILIGAGLLALVILFVLFIPKKNEFTADDYKHLASRLDQLEARIGELDGKEMDIREFDPAQNPVQYQQVINWIKSNAEVISETIKKLDELENSVKNLKIPETAQMAKAPSPPPVPVKKQPLPPETVSPPKPAVKASEAIAIAKPKPAEMASPAPKIIDEKKPSKAPEPLKTSEVAAKPVAEKKSVAPVPPAPPKPVAESPETVRYVFHRVEKGETLYRISRNYATTVEKLQELNNMKKDDLLIHVGQELIVRAEKQ